VATNRGNRWIFLFGFEKNDRANVTTQELEALKKIASDLLKLTPKDLDVLVTQGELQEICHDDQT